MANYTSGRSGYGVRMLHQTSGVARIEHIQAGERRKVLTRRGTRYYCGRYVPYFGTHIGDEANAGRWCDPSSCDCNGRCGPSDGKGIRISNYFSTQSVLYFIIMNIIISILENRLSVRRLLQSNFPHSNFCTTTSWCEM